MKEPNLENLSAALWEQTLMAIEYPISDNFMTAAISFMISDPIQASKYWKLYFANFKNFLAIEDLRNVAAAREKAGDLNEASKVHEKIISPSYSHLGGRIDNLRNAARVFELAGHWVEASDCREKIIQESGNQVDPRDIKSAAISSFNAGRYVDASSYWNQLKILVALGDLRYAAEAHLNAGNNRLALQC